MTRRVSRLRVVGRPRGEGAYHAARSSSARLYRRLGELVVRVRDGDEMRGRHAASFLVRARGHDDGPRSDVACGRRCPARAGTGYGSEVGSLAVEPDRFFAEFEQSPRRFKMTVATSGFN